MVFVCRRHIYIVLFFFDAKQSKRSSEKCFCVAGLAALVGLIPFCNFYLFICSLRFNDDYVIISICCFHQRRSCVVHAWITYCTQRIRISSTFYKCPAIESSIFFKNKSCARRKSEKRKKNKMERKETLKYSNQMLAWKRKLGSVKLNRASQNQNENKKKATDKR